MSSSAALRDDLQSGDPARQSSALLQARALRCAALPCCFMLHMFWEDGASHGPPAVE